MNISVKVSQNEFELSRERNYNNDVNVTLGEAVSFVVRAVIQALAIEKTLNPSGLKKQVSFKEAFQLEISFDGKSFTETTRLSIPKQALGIERTTDKLVKVVGLSMLNASDGNDFDAFYPFFMDKGLIQEAKELDVAEMLN